MTKVMTLLVACEKAPNAGKLLTVEQWMIDYQQSNKASGIMGFVAGDQISVESALYLINYTSDTIACLLIADYIAGSEADFVSLMNQKAADLGLKDTHFVNTTGLQDANHYTTCREMAIIMNELAYRGGVLEKNAFNMFYISPHCPSTLPVYSAIQPLVPYLVELLIYFAVFSLAAYVILLIAMGIGAIIRSIIRKEK
jgi:hypothetical protein